jgi:hypothetical protein
VGRGEAQNAAQRPCTVARGFFPGPINRVVCQQRTHFVVAVFAFGLDGRPPVLERREMPNQVVNREETRDGRERQREGRRNHRAEIKLIGAKSGIRRCEANDSRESGR